MAMEPQTNGHDESGGKRRTSRQLFVLANGNASAAEIVQRAKAKGIRLSMAYVYNIRSEAKASTNAGGRTRAAPRDADQKFIDSVLELGISRSMVLLERIRMAAKNVGTTNQ
jgi:hypothetical protein